MFSNQLGINCDLTLCEYTTLDQNYEGLNYRSLVR
jgi:hypothetical protein